MSWEDEDRVLTADEEDARDIRRGKELAGRHPDYAVAVSKALDEYEEPGDVLIEYIRDEIPLACPVDGLDADCLMMYLSREVEQSRKSTAKAATSKARLGSKPLSRFKPQRPDDEIWYACKPPLSSYAVSNYANVARLVSGKGATARKVLKPRYSMGDLAVQVRLDDHTKRDYKVKWIFENNRPKSAAEIARRKNYEKRRREVD